MNSFNFEIAESRADSTELVCKYNELKNCYILTQGYLNDLHKSVKEATHFFEKYQDPIERDFEGLEPSPSSELEYGAYINIQRVLSSFIHLFFSLDASLSEEIGKIENLKSANEAITTLESNQEDGIQQPKSYGPNQIHRAIQSEDQKEVKGVDAECQFDPKSMQEFFKESLKTLHVIENNELDLKLESKANTPFIPFAGDSEKEVHVPLSYNSSKNHVQSKSPLISKIPKRIKLNISESNEIPSFLLRKPNSQTSIRSRSGSRHLARKFSQTETTQSSDEWEEVKPSSSKRKKSSPPRPLSVLYRKNLESSNIFPKAKNYITNFMTEYQAAYGQSKTQSSSPCSSVSGSPQSSRLAANFPSIQIQNNTNLSSNS